MFGADEAICPFGIRKNGVSFFSVGTQNGNSANKAKNSNKQ
jgi:hypothetical protein